MSVGDATVQKSLCQNARLPAFLVTLVLRPELGGVPRGLEGLSMGENNSLQHLCPWEKGSGIHVLPLHIYTQEVEVSMCLVSFFLPRLQAPRVPRRC